MRRSTSNLLATLLGLTALALTTLPASAAIEAGVRFNDIAQVASPSGETTLELCGTGILRYKRLFKGYAAAFYQPDCQAPFTQEMPAQRLELSYFWSIGGERFGRAAESLLKKNLDAESYDALEARLDTLHSYYQSVSPGDRYTMTYIPGKGTELALNSDPLVTIPGEDFAKAYFGLWLGETPMSSSLRESLLGESQD